MSAPWHRLKSRQARRSPARRSTPSRRPRPPSARSSPPLRLFGPAAPREEDPGSASLPIEMSGNWPGARLRQTGPCAFRCLPLPSAVVRPAFGMRWLFLFRLMALPEEARLQPSVRFVARTLDPFSVPRPVRFRSGRGTVFVFSRRSQRREFGAPGIRSSPDRRGRDACPATRRLRPIRRAGPLAPAQADVYSANRPDVNTGAGNFLWRPSGRPNPELCGNLHSRRVAILQHWGSCA